MKIFKHTMVGGKSKDEGGKDEGSKYGYST
jgi:hypothetical protein